MSERERTPEEIKHRTDPRYFEIPQPCQHCKNLVSMGNQFDEEGWTCKAYPSGIPYGILTNRQPHTEPTQLQEGVAVFDPVIYKEEDTGREWHYTADARWEYVEPPKQGDLFYEERA